jgi:lipoate-protein ligase A
MAVDEVLLASANRLRVVTLRMYGWSEPTLSLGYFQQYQERHMHHPSRACPVVRRSSGGGALVHDCEWTYSLSVPTTERWARRSELLYTLVHQALIDLCAEHGIGCRLAQPPALARQPEPFLCFQRRSTGDVLLGSFKIAGSAQRRSRGAILQHGSLILQRSTAAPSLPGLTDLVLGAPPPEAWPLAWADKIGAALGIGFYRNGLTASEKSEIDPVIEARFASDNWTKKR